MCLESVARSTATANAIDPFLPFALNLPPTPNVPLRHIIALGCLNPIPAQRRSVRKRPKESDMSTQVAKVAAGGLLAVLGLVVLKFIIGIFVGVTALFMIFITKIVPILLVGLVVVWLWKKLTRKEGATG